ncbi:MAG: cellulase family glycosylhydrolase [Nitrososphaerota archaeon]|nr:cellulase family glycosylhydrolase [Nitrososphaerota archaeon]
MNGKLVVAGTSTPFIARGFTSEALSYPSQYATTLCSSKFQASAAAADLQQAQVAITAAPLPGLAYNATFQAMVKDWHANVVRLQVSQGALVYEREHQLNAYTQMVRKVIDQARAAGLIVILSMQTELYSCTPYENGALQKLPDVNTQDAWAKLLNSVYNGTQLESDKGVVLEVFNEPSAVVACNVGTWPETNWTDWATGCGTEPGQGMLTVGKWLRQKAPNNVILFDGDSSAYTFQGFVVPSDMPVNSAYTVHPFDYVTSGSESDSISNWNARFGDFENSGHAVLITAWNEAFQCPNDPNQTITDDFVQNYLPAHSIGLMGYGWDAPVLQTGYLVNSYDYSGNTANYQVVDPNTSGCAEDGGNILQLEFQSEAAQ